MVDAPLQPLPYLTQVAAVLAQEHPKAFAALSSSAARTDSAEVNAELLRHAYRLDPQGHPAVHAAAARAATALGVTVPIDLFAFEGPRSTNAELIFVPDRAVIAMSGDTLNLLDADELCAVTGHELAHYLLWTIDDGRYLAATRLLDAAEGDARTSCEYLETTRRLRLATELFADRGSLLACGSLTTTLSSLLKVTTGLSQVDPRSYLRQAAEVDLGTPSAGTSHPETVLRAWALQLWDSEREAAEPRIAQALSGRLDLASLDILDQDRLRSASQALVLAVLGDESMRTPDVLDHAGQFGVTPQSAPQDRPDPGGYSPDTRKYLAAVLFDFATVDPELAAESMPRMLVLAERSGLAKEFTAMLATELELTERAASKLRARSEELARG